MGLRGLPCRPQGPGGTQVTCPRQCREAPRPIFGAAWTQALSAGGSVLHPQIPPRQAALSPAPGMEQVLARTPNAPLALARPEQTALRGGSLQPRWPPPPRPSQCLFLCMEGDAASRASPLPQRHPPGSLSRGAPGEGRGDPGVRWPPKFPGGARGLGKGSVPRRGARGESPRARMGGPGDCGALAERGC